MKKLLISIFAILIGLSFAQESVVISPQSIVVNPKAPKTFSVDVWVDRDPGGTSRPKYQIGEDITIGVRVSEASYIYLFDIRSNGEIDQILPNKFDEQGKSNFLQAGETKMFPHPSAPYTFKVDGPAGLDKLFVVASKDALAVTTLASFSNDPNFASSNLGQQGFAKTLSIIVAPKPTNSWVTDATEFVVGNPPSIPTYGTISIESNPSGAAVYVDNVFAGITPTSYGTLSGSHNVSIKQAGYQDFNSSVNVQGGRVVRVRANLNAIARNGRLNLSSTPSGAQVFIDGRAVGSTPLVVDLPEGGHSVEFKRAGYSTATTNVNVRVNQTVSYNAILSQLRREGQVNFDSNPRGAQVTINGRVAGVTPTSTITMPEGSYQAQFTLAGYETVTKSFNVGANSRQTVSANMRMVPQFGNFVINSNVRSALVFIDGQQQGTIPAGNRFSIANIPAGSHEIIVIAPGYRSLCQEFNVVAGQTVSVNANLSRR